MSFCFKEDDGNDSDESLIIENVNSPIYDRKSEGYVRFLDPKWIKEHCQNKFIVQLKYNINRALTVTDYVKEGIQRNMTYLRNLHCTHVYKFTCKKTLEQKFCTTIMTKKKKSTTQSFEYMFGNEIKKEWLYEVAVKLHQCLYWYDIVMDPKVSNKVFELPVAAVAKYIEKTCKEHDDFVLKYPQNGKGTCGISALSSTFYYRYDTNLASLIHLQASGYINSLSEPGLKKSRKSSLIKILNQINLVKPFKMYYVERKKQMIPWKEFLRMTKYYDHIFLCIVDSNALSRDHIIAITRG